MDQKIVIYTQRVEIVKSYGERRDCADQNIPCFLETCGYLPIPVPNALKEPAVFAESLHPCGIVLTGGNSLEKYGGAAPERDRTDSSLIAYAVKNGIPLYGFCRGMQSILDFFGCILQPVKHHVAVRHRVHGIWGEYEVNSYHNQACMEVVGDLEVVAWAEDGVVEAVVSREYPIMATMWHPERENPFLERDLKRIRGLFEEKGN